MKKYKKLNILRELEIKKLRDKRIEKLEKINRTYEENN